MKLKDLELISSGAFEASAGTLAFQRKDELLVFDNATAALNKAAAIYFFSGGSWRSTTAGFPVSDDVEILPSQGFVIRKSTGASDSLIVWKEEFNAAP